MPNMRLTDKDVTALLGYIEGESRRIEAVRSGTMADHSMHHGGKGEHAASTADGGEPAQAMDTSHEQHAGMR